MPEQRSPEAKKRRAAKHAQWLKSRYETITIAAPKGSKERYRAAATAEEKSLNRWILNTLDEAIKGDT